MADDRSTSFVKSETELGSAGIHPRDIHPRDIRRTTAARLVPVAILLALVLSIFLVFSVWAGVPGAASMEVSVAEGEMATVGAYPRTEGATPGEMLPRAYLPYVNRYLKPRTSVFGVQIWPGQGGSLADEAADVGAAWVRYGDVYWSKIEATQGQRDWSSLESFDRDLAALQGQGLNTSVIVLGAPEWAQKRPPYQCGPIAEDALDDFASFMQDLVRRYSGPPYYIKHWELGNEPDIDPSFVQPNNFFGCWGDLGDPYYGGEYYATMLKVVYPAIKAADPQAQVLIGGMLMDCDPGNPPENSPDNCLSGKFFEGILKGGGGDYFDIVAYHAYPHWRDNGQDDDLDHFNWKHLGGSLLGKASHLRSVMASYGVDKPLLMNEGGLLCYPGSTHCPGDKFHHAQAAYAIKLYTRTWANGLLGSVWYTLNGPGWREGGLMDGSTPRPAYNAIKFFSGLLKDAQYRQTLLTGTWEAYAFADGANTYLVYWSNTEADAGQILAPVGMQAVYDMFGTPLSGVTTLIPVGTDPVIIKLGE